MRQITVKYEGECRRCGNELSVGDIASHEKHIGLFCVGHEAEGDELREYRQEALDRRSDRLKERAGKRREKAGEIQRRDQHLMNDHAYLTQPHVPGRDKVFARRMKAAELSAEAEQLEKKASRKTARVKGDAANRDEQRRESVREWIQPGMRVYYALVGFCSVEKVNRKTARVRLESSGNSYAEDLVYLQEAEQ